ncbi:MAG TPA: hypothetical protein VN580_13985 [Clostridia bacterium]|nr:hypothetical protein [Clostridia bacterium]
MAVSSISSIYSSLYASLISKIKSTEGTTAEDGSGTSSGSDILELGSSENYLSAYLNYDSTGNYSSRTTLLDYLSESDEDENTLMGILGSDYGEDSDSDIFDSLISAKSEEIDNLISIAMEKLESKATDTGNAEPDDEE